MEQLKAIFEAYIAQVQEGKPWWSAEQVQEAADDWFDRNGLARGAFKYDKAGPMCDPCPPEADAVPAEPVKGLADGPALAMSTSTIPTTATGDEVAPDPRHATEIKPPVKSVTKAKPTNAKTRGNGK